MTESTVGNRGFEPSKITIYVKNRGIVLEESLPILHCLQICSVFIYTGLWDMITHL